MISRRSILMPPMRKLQKHSLARLILKSIKTPSRKLQYTINCNNEVQPSLRCGTILEKATKTVQPTHCKPKSDINAFFTITSYPISASHYVRRDITLHS